MIRAVLSTFLLLVIAVQSGLAQDEPNIEFHGFFLGTFTARAAGQRPGGKEGGDFLLAEERLRLDIGAWLESVDLSARGKGDFFHDALTGKFDVDLREAYADYTLGDFDFRLGRQIATRGVGDLLFINDVFPKDWISFFSGRPLEYLKIGVDGFRARYSSAVINAELFIIPFFTSDNVLTAKRFFLFDPFATVTLREEQSPKMRVGNTEFALRLYRKIGGFDLSVYAYRGFWRSPSIRPDSPASPTRVTLFYPELSVYGISSQKSALAGILSFESGYYHSRNDKDGNDPAIPNSQVRALIGYQRQLWEDFILGLQYYVELMEGHGAYRQSLPPGFPSQKQYRDTITLRLTQLLSHQTLKLSLFAFYSPADNDFVVQPYVSYKLSDSLLALLGGNIFGGEKDTTFFGQLDKNDNVYLSVRYDF